MDNDAKTDPTGQESATGYTGERGPGQKLLGEILLEEGFLTAQDLVRLVHYQRGLPAGDRRPLGRLAVEMGFLSDTQLRHLLDRHGKRISLGELLVARGAIGREDLQRGLAKQAESGGLLGEILIDLGSLDEVTLAITLAEQADLPYIPLGAEDPLEPDLARWVNRAYAYRHGVVPVGRLGRRLTIALWHPASFPYCDELTRATGYDIRPVLSTRSQVLRRLGELYEQADVAKAPLKVVASGGASEQSSAPARGAMRPGPVVPVQPPPGVMPRGNEATASRPKPVEAQPSLDLLLDLGLPSPELKSLRSLVRQSEGSLLMVGARKHGIEATYERLLQYAQGEGDGPSSPKDRLVEGAGELNDFRAAERFLRPRNARVFRLAWCEAEHSTAAWSKVIELGAPPDRAAQQLSAVLALVAVRINCEACLSTYEPRPIVLSEWFGNAAPVATWRHGEGCEQCGGSGYRGEGWVAEYWVPNESDRRLMTEGLSTRRLRDEALPRIEGLGPRGITLALAGRTTLEELLQKMPAEEVRHVRLGQAQKQQRKAS